MKFQTPDQWLTAALPYLHQILKVRVGARDEAAVAKLNVKKIDANCSFPSRGALSEKHQRIGEHWGEHASPVGRQQVLVSPTLGDPAEVLHVLLHELIHCVEGCAARHRGAFARIARKAGLLGSIRRTYASPELANELKRVSRELGAYPRKGLVAEAVVVRRQSTRMMKAACSGCGYTIRITRRWSDVGLPRCPVCADRLLELEREVQRSA